ncbi:hypothetical protein BdWA1_001374 [Babesia duncani]|uniref:Uncharacterized protein n=1 Tax=Babesia duncani TaxID=323732 RepID=A0AAD9PPH9_9APIC|nr:hypothetical protein BdWA1_001374 [Babesia duncani]
MKLAFLLSLLTAVVNSKPVISNKYNFFKNDKFAPTTPTRFSPFSYGLQATVLQLNGYEEGYKKYIKFISNREALVNFKLLEPSTRLQRSLVKDVVIQATYIRFLDVPKKTCNPKTFISIVDCEISTEGKVTMKKKLGTEEFVASRKSFKATKSLIFKDVLNNEKGINMDDIYVHGVNIISRI